MVRQYLSVEVPSDGFDGFSGALALGTPEEHVFGTRLLPVDGAKDMTLRYNREVHKRH
jgi:hypothetical protein